MGLAESVLRGGPQSRAVYRPLLTTIADDEIEDN